MEQADQEVQLIKVTIKLEWDAARVGKTIPTDATHTTKVRDGTVLLDILNEAADEKKTSPFNKYESTYYGGMGYFITAFNGIKSDPATNTYWMIYDEKTEQLVPLGVSQYQPKHDSVTVFRFEEARSQGCST